MKIIRLAIALLFFSGLSTLPAQPTVPAKDPPPPAATEPLVVDVHPSPYRSTIYYSSNVGNQRFDMRDATILDMIALAYNHESDAILGGPTWIDFDHFDVVARISSLKPMSPSRAGSPMPPENPYDHIRPTLQQVLAERFHLKYHTEERPLPGYIMTIAKDGAKLAEAKDPTAPSNCDSAQDKATPGQYIITCTSQTVTQLISNFGGVFPHPVIDHTGLKKSYDFNLKLLLNQVQTREDYVRTFTDVLKQQLGLVIAAADVPQPAIFVDAVDHTPTPNAPDIAKLIPPIPDLEFEVATIKPTADNEPRGQVRPAGSQITFGGFSLQELLVEAWQLPTGAMLGSAPPWIDQKRYTITVKLPADIDARTVFQDRDLIANMLQKLLVDRFQIKYHWGEQTQSGWVLLAGSLKMKKADPNSRTFCKHGPPEGEKDVRTAPDSPFDREFHCQNITMAQFADLAQNLAASEIKNHVINKTDLAGSYDFTLFYTTGRKLRTDSAAAVAAAKQTGDTATSDPVAGLTVEDAFRKELGLRLERQPNSFPALVLDHIEQTPTEN